jgi:23S rRNA pseudouridine1911/1915/1917 synthase
MCAVSKSVKNYSVMPSIAEPASINRVVSNDCAGLRLDQALARLLPEFSRSRLVAWIKTGRVTLDGTTPSQRQKVWGGENLSVRPALDAETLAYQAEDIPLDIIYEDGTLLVVNKPAGLVVHPGSGNWQGTMLNALLRHAPPLQHVPRAGIVHRLDKDTSGLLVVAKTLEAQTALVRQLQAHSVKREYLALVHGIVPRAGKVEAPIGRHPAARTRMAVLSRGKPAVTHYAIVARSAHTTLLRCRLETGRTHQIRVHMREIGHPLVGDPVYGAKKKIPQLEFSRQALHAERLELTHPESGRRVHWQAALPVDMSELLKRLNIAAS